jgi:hypothetical protein
LLNRYRFNVSVAVLGFCLLAIAGCGPTATIEERIPAIVKSGDLTWKRGPAEPLALGGMSKNFGQGSSFVYSGMGGITVHVIEMKSEPSAFEALQGWRTTPGMAAARRGNLFFITSFEQPETAEKFMAVFLDHVRK